jgi:CDGSH-type Zn-finger protein
MLVRSILEISNNLRPHREFLSSSSLSSVRRTSFSSSTSSQRPPVHEIFDKNEPYIYSYEGVRVTVEANRTYKWCACGLSANQPWCDNSHLDYKMSIRPVQYTPTKSGNVNLCGCKHSRRRPYCDGAHSFLHSSSSKKSSTE